MPLTEKEKATIIVIVIFTVALWGIYLISEQTRTRFVYVDIKYSGSWQGHLAYGNKVESISGIGNERYKISWKGPGVMILIVSIIKTDTSNARLWIGILNEREQILDQGETTAPYGGVSITWTSR